MIVLAVRWYLRFGLSYRDVEELLAEHGIEVDHVTVYRWVQWFTPLLAEAARPCRHAVGDRWQVDETYVKVTGRWGYVYRAIDQFGQIIDVFVSSRRDATAARRFFQQAIGTTNMTPVEVVTDRAAAPPRLWAGFGRSKPVGFPSELWCPAKLQRRPLCQSRSSQTPLGYRQSELVGRTRKRV